MSQLFFGQRKLCLNRRKAAIHLLPEQGIVTLQIHHSFLQFLKMGFGIVLHWCWTRFAWHRFHEWLRYGDPPIVAKLLLAVACQNAVDLAAGIQLRDGDGFAIVRVIRRRHNVSGPQHLARVAERRDAILLASTAQDMSLRAEERQEAISFFRLGNSARARCWCYAKRLN